MSVDMIALAGAAFMVPVLGVTIVLFIWLARQAAKSKGDR